MRAWVNAVDWFSATVMVTWLLLVASFGYAAMLVALRPPPSKA